MKIPPQNWDCLCMTEKGSQWCFYESRSDYSVHVFDSEWSVFLLQLWLRRRGQQATKSDFTLTFPTRLLPSVNMSNTYSMYAIHYSSYNCTIAICTGITNLKTDNRQ